MKMDPKFKPELCVSGDDSRYNLSRTYFDADRNVVVATDGRMLVAVPAEVERGDAPGFCSPEDLRVARGEVSDKDAKWWKKKAKFPKYEQVIPEFQPGDEGTVTVALSAKYLLAIAQALAADHDGVVLTFQHKDGMAGLGPMLVRAVRRSPLLGPPEKDGGAFAALMPIRVDLASERERTNAVSAPAPLPKAQP